MSNDTTGKNLFAGKARTVAAVAAFSGLALATTVSVQATQNADEQAPAAAVSEAPTSENTVSAEPAAKAVKAQEKKTEKAEPAAKAAAQPSVVQAAPVADVTPLEAPAAQVVPAAQNVTPVAEQNVTPVAEQAPAAQVAPASQNVTPVAEQAPAVSQAPAATQVVPASQNVTPVAEQAPAAQGRHVAQPTQQTLNQENTARQDAQVYTGGTTQTTGHQGGGTVATTSNVTTQSTTTHKTPAKTASHVSASGKGGAILGAAEAQVGEYQDCTALVSDSLAAVGINFHGWPADYKSLGHSVSAADAQAGDIAYYANGGAGMAHVAIYAGNGQAIHGGWNGNQTVKTSAYVGSGPEFIRVG